MTNKLSDCLVIYASKSALEELDRTIIWLASFAVTALVIVLVYKIWISNSDPFLHKP